MGDNELCIEQYLISALAVALIRFTMIKFNPLKEVHGFLFINMLGVVYYFLVAVNFILSVAEVLGFMTCFCFLLSEILYTYGIDEFHNHIQIIKTKYGNYVFCHLL